MENNNKVRESNFELCRIIAMLMIISGHFTQQSGILDQNQNTNLIWALIFGSGSGIADNLFVLIGAYFLVDKKFKFKRVFNIYIKVFIYCIPITIFMLIYAPKYVNLKDIMRGFIPFSGSPLWFASCYIIMLLMTPFMNELLNNPKKTKFILIFLFFINCIPSTILLRNDFFFSGEFVWFCFLYLLVGYYKKYYHKKNFFRNKYTSIIFSLIIYFSLIFIYISINYLSERYTVIAFLNNYVELDTYFIRRYHTLPAFICSLLIFNFFENLEINKNIFINKLSKSTFAVYIIHQTPSFVDYLWFGIFKADIWINSKLYPLLYIGMILIIFIFSCLIDLFVEKYIEKKILKMKNLDVVFKKVENKYNFY